MSFSWFNLFTVLGSAAATIVPMVVPIIPPPYNLAASAVIAAVSAVFHLFRPSPMQVHRS